MYKKKKRNTYYEYDYEKYFRFIEFEVIDLVKTAEDCRFKPFLEPSKIIKFEYNKDYYYNMTFPNGGMINYELMDFEYIVSLYE